MDLLIPCLGIVAIVIVIFGFLAFLRYMNYKESLALAEKGLAKPEMNEPRHKRTGYPPLKSQSVYKLFLRRKAAGY